MHHIFWELVLQHGVEQAGELCMQALVARDELVRESEAGHQAALLEPVDRTERAAEEDTLDASESYDSLRETVIPVHPLDRPLRLLPHCRHGVDRVEDMVPLGRVA